MSSSWGTAVRRITDASTLPDDLWGSSPAVALSSQLFGIFSKLAFSKGIDNSAANRTYRAKNLKFFSPVLLTPLEAVLRTVSSAP
jgi:hypothetical protein